MPFFLPLSGAWFLSTLFLNITSIRTFVLPDLLFTAIDNNLHLFIIYVVHAAVNHSTAGILARMCVLSFADFQM